MQGCALLCWPVRPCWAACPCLVGQLASGVHVASAGRGIRDGLHGQRYKKCGHYGRNKNDFHVVCPFAVLLPNGTMGGLL